jgi:hypothetical protein
LAERDTVLVVLLGQGVGKIRCMPTSGLGETDNFVSGEMSHETIE